MTMQNLFSQLTGQANLNTSPSSPNNSLAAQGKGHSNINVKKVAVNNVSLNAEHFPTVSASALYLTTMRAHC